MAQKAEDPPLDQKPKNTVRQKHLTPSPLDCSDYKLVFTAACALARVRIGTEKRYYVLNA
jgi:hypothetical protein